MYNICQIYPASNYPPPHPRENDPLLSQLHEAASSGNTEACASLIERKPQIVNIVKREIGTALHAAAAGGHAETIKRLIVLGAKPEIEYISYTPLHLAVSMGRTMAVKALLDNNSDPEAYQDGGDNPGPLHEACSEGNIEIARSLIQAGADVHRHDWEGLQPLHLAADCDDPDLIGLLLDAGADPNMLADGKNRTPLHRAATAGNLRTVKALLTGGADPDGFRVKQSCCARVPKNNHFPPIGFAIINNHHDVVLELVRSNADLKPPIKIRKALKEVIDNKSFQEHLGEKDKEKLLGKFEPDHPVFDKTMEPIEYSIYTGKTKMIGALMMSSKYSNNDVDSLIRLTEIHELTKSQQAINKYSGFIPPESLQVLSGRAVKQNIKRYCPDQEQATSIKKLTIPENLQHFLQQPIDINKPQNS